MKGGSARDFWSGIGYFAYNTFHIWYIFIVYLELVWRLQQRIFYILLGAKLVLEACVHMLEVRGGSTKPGCPAGDPRQLWYMR